MSPWVVIEIGYLFAFLALSRWLWKRVVAGRVDPFLAIFAFSALLYMEAAPAILAILGRQAQYTSPAISRLDLPLIPVSGYVVVQTLTWLLFIGPLLFVYSRFPRVRSSGPAIATLRVSGGHWKLFCSASVAFSLLFIYELATHKLLFRRVGASAAIAQLTGLSTAIYGIVRLFALSGYFLAGILTVMFVWAENRYQRRVIAISLGVTSACFLISAAANSRLDAVIYLVAVAGWYKLAGGALPRPAKRLRKSTIASLVLLAVVLVEVALNVRVIMPARAAHLPAAVKIYFPITVNELGRVDGVDLIARIAASGERPAWGRAWVATPWLLRRLVDRSGYSAFVQTGQTTAKQYLTQRDLGIAVPDFYSTCLTDMFGNFWWIGFPVAAIILGVGFGLARRWLERGRRAAPWMIVLSVYVASSWLLFEQEAQALFFGWISTLPVFIATLLFPPFARVSEGHKTTPPSVRPAAPRSEPALSPEPALSRPPGP